MRLSKSKFIAGLQCLKRLYWEVHQPESAPEFDEQSLAIMEQGQEVGRCAQKAFPGGVLIEAQPEEMAKALQLTQQAVRDRRYPAIFEATFSYDNILARVDILERLPRNKWRLIEVKSSTKVKDYYVYDVAIQRLILEGLGMTVVTCLMHLNRQYIYDGEQYDLKELFVIQDLTDETAALEQEVKDLLREEWKALTKRKAPDIEPGSHCTYPFCCEFYDICNKPLPADHIAYLPGIKQKTLEELASQGIESIKKIPKEFPLTEPQRRAWECARTGKPWFGKGLKEALSDLRYPLYFMDFETLGVALPRYAGMSPYDQIPFQWSVHVQRKPGAELEHYEFLADDSNDPRQEFAKTLCRIFGKKGNVLAYNRGFEWRCLADLAEIVPKYRAEIENIQSRLWDPLPVIRANVYDSEFRGSYSLKSVLPALVGLTFCPGKKQAISQTGPWDRDLETDLKIIQCFGSAALVTLMEDHELQGVMVPPDKLQAGSSAHGMEWHHLAIRDVSIPDEHFEDLWVYSGMRLRRLLAQGRNIVIHCRGGLGRTGMIGARLLVELGLEPEEAIRRVRTARPGAIETPDQEKHVRGCRKAALPGADPTYGERFLGCLLGGAVGDAFGYAVEFSTLSEIRKRFGHGGIQEPSLTDGRLVVSDDTQMTLFTLDGILKGLEAPSPSKETFVESIRLSYLDWLGTQGAGHRITPKGDGWLARCPAMQAQRAAGRTCLNSLMCGGHGTIEKHLNDSKGCGGAMRSASVGLLRLFDPKHAFELGARSAAITHGHPSGYLSAGMVSTIVRYLMDDMDIHAAAEKSLQILRGWDGHEETVRAITKALDLAMTASKDHPTTIHSIGGGWVGEEALAIALYAVLVGGSYGEVVRIASNHDGDSDSTASIAGQIWGTWKGLIEIPHEWITELDVFAPVLRLAQETLESASLV